MASHLERIRATRPLDGTTMESGALGTSLGITWLTAPGRGRPDRVDVTGAWAGHTAAMSSAEPSR